VPASEESETGDLGRLEALLRTRAHRSESVRWALIDPLGMYLGALRHRLTERDPAALGARLAAAIDAWAPRLPIGDFGSRLSQYDRGSELEFLTRALLRTEEARSRFAVRLLAAFEDDEPLAATLRGERLAALLRDRGFLGGDTPWPS